jgi:hypothetical protein
MLPALLADQLRALPLLDAAVDRVAAAIGLYSWIYPVLWWGPAGARSGLHYDVESYNMLGQVAGTKNGARPRRRAHILGRAHAHAHARMEAGRQTGMQRGVCHFYKCLLG